MENLSNKYPDIVERIPRVKILLRLETKIGNLDIYNNFIYIF